MKAELFDLIDGVWLAELKCAIPVALSLRQGLIDVAAARQSQQGQLTKMELVYAVSNRSNLATEWKLSRRKIFRHA